MNNFVFIAVLSVVAAAAPVAAQPGQGQDRGKQKMENTRGQGGSDASRRLGARERSGQLGAINPNLNCPPGLAKKGNGCLPPGQAKKLYNVGQRYNRDLRSTWTYNDIPDYLRSQRSLDRDARYHYESGYLYQIDPKTMLVRQAIEALQR